MRGRDNVVRSYSGIRSSLPRKAILPWDSAQTSLDDTTLGGLSQSQHMNARGTRSGRVHRRGQGHRAAAGASWGQAFSLGRCGGAETRVLEAAHGVNGLCL